MTPYALLVADDGIAGELTAYILGREGLEVLTAASRQDALERLPGRKYDLLVVQVMEFGPEWAEFVRAARARFASALLVMAASANNPDALAAYEAGADDYLSLPSSPSIFLAKVRVWLRRTAAVPPCGGAGLEVGALRLDLVHRRLHGAGAPPVRLSALETRVLHFFMVHPGQVLPADLILEQVWGCKGKEDGALVKNVVYRLRRKMQAASGASGWIQTAPEGGYLLPIPRS